MKRIFLLSSIVIIFLSPASALGQDNPQYFKVKLGTYFFSDDLKDAHPMGFNGEIVYGYHLNHELVLEGGAGYFHDGVPKGNDVRGKSFTISVKKKFSAESFEPFAGAGLGVYATKYEESSNGDISTDTDTVFGGHLFIGMNYNVTPSMFIGIEGKYIFTEKAKYNGVKADLDGFATMLSLGFRL